MREWDGNDGLVGVLPIKRKITRKWRLHVSLQDGPELGLSPVMVNLKDGRISANIEVAVWMEVDGSWCPCNGVWDMISSWPA